MGDDDEVGGNGLSGSCSSSSGETPPLPFEEHSALEVSRQNPIEDEAER